MSGKMRRGQNSLPKETAKVFHLARSFKASQKDNSVRSKKKAGRNDYTDQAHQEKKQ